MFPRQYPAQPLTPPWPQCHEMFSHVTRLKNVYDETNVLPKMKEYASLLGGAAYYQWQKGLLKESSNMCFLARTILDKVAEDTSLHEAAEGD